MRPLFLRFVTLLLPACLVPAASVPPPANIDATAAITVLREGLIDSFVKADIDRLLTFLDPDAGFVFGRILRRIPASPGSAT